MSAKWRAHTSTRVSINPSQKACIENRVMSTDTHEQVMRHQVTVAKSVIQAQIIDP